MKIFPNLGALAAAFAGGLVTVMASEWLFLALIPGTDIATDAAKVIGAIAGGALTALVPRARPVAVSLVFGLVLSILELVQIAGTPDWSSSYGAFKLIFIAAAPLGAMAARRALAKRAMEPRAGDTEYVA